MKKTVIGIGEILWDIFPDKKIPGGAPSNFAFHASQLGLESYTVSAVGKDILGIDIIDSLKAKSLNYIIEKVDHPTGQVHITLNNEGVPDYKILEDVAWDNIPYSDNLNELALQTDIICFGTLAQRNTVSRNTIQQLLHAVPKHAFKIFDINIRQNFYTKEIIENSLHLCNVLKLNNDEVTIIKDLLNIEITDKTSICKFLLDRYDINIIILTNGGEDSFIFTESETSHLLTPKVRIVDTVGAGDSFTATFIASYIHNQNISKAHKLAVEVSAYVCTQHGGMPTLPDVYKKAIG